MNLNPDHPVDPVKNPDSASSTHSALDPNPAEPRPPSLGRPLTQMLQLSEREIERINTWLKEGVSPRKIVESCRTEFQKEIPYMTIVRYSNRTHLFRDTEALNESKEIAAELSKYAVTGDATFSTNTLELLEQKAFDLALVYSRDSDAADLRTLKDLWTLIHKAKGTQIRQRHATVQEQKIELRNRELDLKTQIFQSRLGGRLNSNGRLNPSRNPNSDSFSRTHEPIQNQNEWDDHNSQSEDGLGSQHAAEPIPFSSDESCNQNQNCGGTRSPSPTSNSRDAIPNNAATPAHQNATIQNPVHPVDPVKTPPSASSAPSSPSALKSFLSPEVIANTNLYDQKIDCGEIRVIYAPGKHYEIEYCNPADQPALERLHKSAPLRFFEDPTRTQWLPGLRTFGPNPYIPPTTATTDLPPTTALSTLNAQRSTPVNPVHPVQNPSEPAASKSEIKNQKPEIPETQNSKLNTQNSAALSPEELPAVVDRYTVNRVREYITHNQKHTPWPHRRTAPEFITEKRHCPCGHACPCPTHETIPDVGPFPPIFWKLTPFSSGYAECLQDRNLPFRRPDEYLA